jgi:choline dehydrogenase
VRRSPEGPWPEESWDHIIVGGGSAGCALAARLSQRGGARILLLEAGPPDSGLGFRVPAAVLWTVDNPRYDWCYDFDPDPSRDGRVQRGHAGRVLGGGSSINGMIYARGAAADFDDWAAAGATGWGYRDVLPFFQAAETRVGGDPAYRGQSGPLHIEDPRSIHPTTQRFLAAAAEVGIPRVADYNAADPSGASLAQLTQRRGLRQSTSRAYRSLAPRSPVVRTRASATGLLFEGQRCVGVRYRWRGQSRDARGASVTLSAGSIGSPKLLLLAGIGDGAELALHGIRERLHLPGVGRNLADHIGAGVGVHVTVPTYNLESGLWDQLRHGLRWLATRRGPATTPLCQAVAFCRADGKPGRADLQLMFSPLALGEARGPEHSSGRGPRITPHARAGIGIYADLGRPNARGRVSLKSADPEAPPRIAYPLLDNPEDVATLIRGCRLAREILRAPSLRGIVADERFPGEATDTDAEWREALKSLVSVFHHPTGTCAMGTDTSSVVDPTLRVHGIDGLHVADASVMPLPINGNTNAAAIMIAERAAAWLSGSAASI